jgi:hypothetical protein
MKKSPALPSAVMLATFGARKGAGPRDDVGIITCGTSTKANPPPAAFAYVGCALGDRLRNRMMYMRIPRCREEERAVEVTPKARTCWRPCSTRQSMFG